MVEDECKTPRCYSTDNVVELYDFIDQAITKLETNVITFLRDQHEDFHRKFAIVRQQEESPPDKIWEEAELISPSARFLALSLPLPEKPPSINLDERHEIPIGPDLPHHMWTIETAVDGGTIKDMEGKLNTSSPSSCITKAREILQDRRQSEEASDNQATTSEMRTQAVQKSISFANLQESGQPEQASDNQATTVVTGETRTLAMQKSISYGDLFRGKEDKTKVRAEISIEYLVNHPAFESAFASLILFNTLLIAFETELDGIDRGHKLGIAGFRKDADGLLPHAHKTIGVMHIVFGVLFTIEVVLKMVGFRCRFFLSGWNWLDLLVVSCWLLAELALLSLVSNPMVFRLLRLLRLIRLLRLFKSIQELDALHILVTSIRASMSTLFWASMILTAMITIVSIFMTDTVSSYLNDESQATSRQEQVFRYYGTFSRSVWSIFEATFGNFAVPMRVMTNNLDSAWGFPFLVYKITGGFALVSVVVGVFLHETFRVANSDDGIMVIRQTRQKKEHLAKMTRLFEAIDTTGQGAISFEVFREMVNDPYIKTWLSAYELEVADVRNLFELIDDGNGELTAEELCDGVSRLKGSARSIDVHMMMYETMSSIGEVKTLLRSLLGHAGHSKSND